MPTIKHILCPIDFSEMSSPSGGDRGSGCALPTDPREQSADEHEEPYYPDH